MHDTPSSSSCLFTGWEIAGYSEAKLSGIRKETVGFIFRSFNLIGELAVSENAGLVRLHYKIGREERRMRVAAVMIPPIVCLTLHQPRRCPRAREGALRKVVGAKAKDVVQPLVWDFSKPVLIASLLAWPAARQGSAVPIPSTRYARHSRHNFAE